MSIAQFDPEHAAGFEMEITEAVKAKARERWAEQNEIVKDGDSR